MYRTLTLAIEPPRTAAAPLTVLPWCGHWAQFVSSSWRQHEDSAEERAVSDAAYYDPYDVEINADPYPMFRRLREEAPLYYNEPHDFYAVSRYEDVERGLARPGHLHLRPGRHPRAHQGRHRDAAGHADLRGPAHPRPSTAACCPGCSRPGGWPRSSRQDPRVLRPSLDPLVGSGRLRLHRRPRRPDADAGDRHAARHPRGGPGGGPRPGRRQPAHRAGQADDPSARSRS